MVRTHGGAHLDPQCASGKEAGATYSPEQYGVLYTLMVATLYMGTASAYWLAAYAILTRRLRRTCAAIGIPGL